MWNFLLCGIVFLLYAYLEFINTRKFYPSVVFSFMWGLGCIVNTLILGGCFENLFLADYYSFKYLDHYMLFFTMASISAFILSHKIYPVNQVNLKFNTRFLSAIIIKYRWILWVNFFGGILRIILMVRLVGFDNVMDYRLAANTMMNTGDGPIGLVFRLTSYVQMLANFYIALCGLRDGYDTLKLKKVLMLFILYSPTQMATGGRLFILYFVLFYIGSYLLGRSIACRFDKRPLIKPTEKKILTFISVGFLFLISQIAIIRQSDAVNGQNIQQESEFAKITYISEGMLASEHYMRFYPPESIEPDYGEHLFIGHSDAFLRYRGYLQNTFMSSIVISIILPLYTSFGYWGSIIVWGIIAFCLESLAIFCLRRLTLLRFFILITIMKIMYESVISNPLVENMPVYELIILLAIFHSLIFGKLKFEHR